MAQLFAVEAKGIEKSFGSTQALRGVDLQIGVAQCLGLVGRNGAGKSTLVSILSGLSKPDAGEIFFRGEPQNANDMVLGELRDPFDRELVIADFKPVPNSKMNEIAAKFEIVVGRTPRLEE